MNFYIDFARVALAPYPLYRPPTEQPIMKRQLILSLTLAVLAANAYALPAREQAAPQAQASHATVSQVLNTLAADGSSKTAIGERNGDTVSENGFDRTPLGQALAADGSSKTAIGERNGDTVSENGFDRTPLGQALAADGSSKTAIGERNGDTVSENGFDRTPLGQALAADGSSKTAIGKNDEVAEGGRARLEEKGLVEGGGDRVIERNSSLS